MLDKNVNVLIREVNAKVHELEGIKEKVKDKHNWIDREARNCFHGGVGAGMLKYAMGFNHYSKRNAIVNKGLVGSKCPRCERDGDWEHVVLCNR